MLESDDVEITLDGPESNISFVFDEQPADALRPLTAFCAQMDKRIDGSTIELFCARPGHKGPLGVSHWRSVREGLWMIDAAWPHVDNATLTEALALVAAMEGGRRLRARDEPEAMRIVERVERSRQDHFGSNALLRDGPDLMLRRRDNALFELICARVFSMRYSATWQLQDLDK